jgi:ABC-2 type transport system ATP-binding protein
MPTVVLEAEGLSKSYGSLVAVKDLSLAVYEGEVFGFLGPNGAGKTTSINMLCGLLRPDAGRVLVNGQPISGGSADVRARVGMCPQEIVVWEKLSCVEQLEFVGEMYGLKRRVARENGLRLLDELDLAEKRDAQAKTLSGGMWRRLSLALALVHEPSVVVLDEPEAGLDPQSRIRVREFVRSLARQTTVILTTHNMDEAERVADRVAIIDHGELLVLDTPEALLHSVGEGDVLEISLPSGGAADGADHEGLLRELRRVTPEVAIDSASSTLTVRALDAVNLLPTVLDALKRADLAAGDVRLRAASLEDVFIKLTGRRLRG